MTNLHIKVKLDIRESNEQLNNYQLVGIKLLYEIQNGDIGINNGHDFSCCGRCGSHFTDSGYAR